MVDRNWLEAYLRGYLGLGDGDFHILDSDNGHYSIYIYRFDYPVENLHKLLLKLIKQGYSHEIEFTENSLEIYLMR